MTAARLLIVDDHRMFSESLRRMLVDTPSIDVVAVFPTGADAVAGLRESRPDVALVDYRLPDMDGAELTTALRRASPDIRVIMLTGDGSDATIMAAIEAGCVGLIEKAGTADELVGAIDRVMAGEVLFTPALLAHAIQRVRRTGLQLGADLTPREREVLALLADGRPTDDIASTLLLSVHTVRTHIQSILEKLDAHSKLEAVAVALREGIVAVG